MAKPAKHQILMLYGGYAAATVAGLLGSMALCGALPDTPASMVIPLGVTVGLLSASMTSAYKRGLSDGQSNPEAVSDEVP
jgi:hypothetical protein